MDRPFIKSILHRIESEEKRKKLYIKSIFSNPAFDQYILSSCLGVDSVFDELFEEHFSLQK
jgi:hypothetical protein